MGALGATAIVALAAGVLLAPGAQSGATPGLDMTTRNSQTLNVPAGGTRTAAVRCPRGYHATGIGEDVQGAIIRNAQKESPRKVSVTVVGGPSPGFVAVQALCVKGIGGLPISDTSDGFAF